MIPFLAVLSFYHFRAMLCFYNLPFFHLKLFRYVQVCICFLVQLLFHSESGGWGKKEGMELYGKEKKKIEDMEWKEQFGQSIGR